MNLVNNGIEYNIKIIVVGVVNTSIICSIEFTSELLMIVEVLLFE